MYRLRHSCIVLGLLSVGLFLMVVYIGKIKIMYRARNGKSQKPVCSPSIIRDYCVTHSYFPTESTWSHRLDAFPKSRFTPTLCRLKHVKIPDDKLAVCFSRDVRRLAVVGDSNSYRYYLMLLSYLRAIGECTTESNNSYEDYIERTYGNFTRKTAHRVRTRHLSAATLPPIKEHERITSQMRCSIRVEGNKTRHVHVQHFYALSFSSREKSIRCDNSTSNTRHKCKRKSVYQTIFGEYLKSTQYPDVILFFSGSHDKGRGDALNETRKHIIHTERILRDHVPRTTRLFWFSLISENTEKKKIDWRTVKYEGKYTANDQVQRTNRVLFDVVQNGIRTDRILPFFDLYSLSLPIQHLSVDGIHMQSDYYSHVISYWIQVFCFKYM